MSAADCPVPDVSGGDLGRSDVEAKSTPRRPKREVDTDDLLMAIRRQLAALSRRVGSSDTEALRAMLRLRDDLEEQINDAITGLRHDPVAPASWAEIGNALGVGRDAACKRYGKVGGTRRPGGQPSHLR